MLSPYRRILARPGAALFSATGVVARFPMSMVGLGIVLLVQVATGSYGIAGTVSAAYMVANALLAILQGRLLDVLGQRLVLSVASGLFGVFLSLTMWSVQAEWPLLVSCALAAGAGGTLPQIGSCVRARWAHVLDDPTQTQTAYALEAVLDEVVFVVGPILVTVLATTIHPVAGLAVALVACVGGSLAFAAQRATEPPVETGEARRAVPRAHLPWRTVGPLVVAAAALGVLFGAAEVTTVAFSEEQGAKQYAGALLALWALGSLTAGLVSGLISWRRGPTYRLRWGALAMATTMSPLVLVDSMWVMGAAMLVGGLAIAPTLVSVMSLIERTVPRSRLTEGMAIVHTGLVMGVAPGASLSGFVVDLYGASAAYLVSAAAGTTATLAALALPGKERAR